MPKNYFIWHNSNRDFNKIIRPETRRRLQGKDAIEDLATAFQAAESESLRTGERLVLVEPFPVVLGQAKKMPVLLAEADLQVARLRMFDRVMDDLLDHPEDVDLFVFRHPDLLDDIELNIDGLFPFHLLDEFAYRLDEAFPLERVREQVVRDPAHAADDLVEVAGGLVEDLAVGVGSDIDTADVEFHSRKERAEAVVQVPGDAFPLVLADSDLGEDLFALEPHIPAVIPDNADKKIDNDYGNNHRYHQRDIKDPVFHWPLPELELFGSRYFQESNRKNNVCQRINIPKQTDNGAGD